MPRGKVKVGVIAAAGKGTRAYPRTNFIPKPLFVFENRTLLERNVELMFKTLGVERVYVIVGHLKDQVLAEVERIRGRFPGKSIETADWTQRGLAADVANLRDRIDSDFALMLGDEFYYETNHAAMLQLWRARAKAQAMIAVLPTPLVSEIRKNYSVQLAGTRIVELVEKPEDPPNQLNGLGSYFFTQRYFEFFDSTPPSPKSGVIELTQVIDRMARETEAHACTLKGRYFNINSLADYYATTYWIRTQKFSRYRVSLIVPAKNNAATLPDVLSDFADLADEILVVDMGSTDRTAELARKKGARVIEVEAGAPPSAGPRADLIYQALRAARGDILALAPADGSFRTGDFAKLLEYLKDCDMVVGTRTTRQMIEQGANLRPFYRWVNVFFGKLVEIFWWGQEPRFTDIGCAYRAIWKDSFARISGELEARDRTYLLEMMIEIMRYHMRCIEIPVSYYRAYGSSSQDSLAAQGRYMLSVLRLIIARRFFKR